MRVLVVVLLLVLMAAPSLAGADPREEPMAADALQALRDGHYVRARELAEKMLQANQSSVVGSYVLGSCYYNAEASLPKSRHYLEKALRLLEQQHPTPIPDSGPWALHADILESLINTVGDLEDYTGQMALLDRFNELYTPVRKAAYGWPLMKLGQLDEATRRMKEVIAAGGARENELRTALNTLGAIEDEREDPEASRAYFERLVREVKQHGWDQRAEELANTGLTCLQTGDPKTAESMFVEATGQDPTWTFANPWANLASLYTLEGRIPEALSAAKSIHPWNDAKTAVLNQQGWAEDIMVCAEVLLAAGLEDRSLAILDRVAHRPDRSAGTSTHPWLRETGTRLLHWSCLDARRERLLEEGPTLGWGAWLKEVGERALVESAMREAASQAGALLAGNSGLADAMRPYHVRVVGASLTAPSFIRMLGPGVVAVQMERLLARDVSDPKVKARADRERPYLLALLGECRVRQGRMADATAALTEALAGLPQWEVLLRARVEALLGDATGDTAHFARVMDMDPGALRRTGVALPATFSDDGTQIGMEARRMLEKSVRFSSGGPFRVQVTATSAALLGPDGSVLREAEMPKGGDAGALARELLQVAFAPKLDLSQMDLNSLDGSNAAGPSNRDQIIKLFEAK